MIVRNELSFRSIENQIPICLNLFVCTGGQHFQLEFYALHGYGILIRFVTDCTQFFQRNITLARAVFRIDMDVIQPLIGNRFSILTNTCHRYRNQKRLDSLGNSHRLFGFNHKVQTQREVSKSNSPIFACFFTLVPFTSNVSSYTFIIIVINKIAIRFYF